MSSAVVQLYPDRAPPSAPAGVDNPNVYTFGQVAWQLGIKGKDADGRQRETGWQLGYVIAMIAGGFPAPLPAYNHKQRKLIDAVTPGSKWQRHAVDAWFEGNLPPGARAALVRSVEVRDHAALDENAAHLFDHLAARRARA